MFKEILDNVAKWESYDPVRADSFIYVTLYYPTTQEVPMGRFKVIDCDGEIWQWNNNRGIVYD